MTPRKSGNENGLDPLLGIAVNRVTVFARGCHCEGKAHLFGVDHSRKKRVFESAPCNLRSGPGVPVNAAKVASPRAAMWDILRC